MSNRKRKLELLAPARDLACGKAAIDHGADAVYIGPERFGARSAVGNSLEDIRQLCDYAHLYDAKVYATVNTIVYDHELKDTSDLLQGLHGAGVDAVLLQDMGVLALMRKDKIAMEVHASTQTDNRSADKVAWLRDLGFRRVVLARELSVREVADIHNAVPDVDLEVFVHGALCVCYSGICYASQACFHRSANRGECAQFCRMKFDLEDSDGRVWEKGRHLLSLKDMKQIENLGALAEAGATSFKIEGRLKDITYVKNVTAAYSQALDAFIALHPERYERASLGHCDYSFTPHLNKTFNRGYTTYFAAGRQPGISSPDTPKALGEYVGKVKEIRGASFTVAGLSSFANGDGLCFINRDRELEGFRVNRVEGNRLFPLKMPAALHPGTALYRNNDQEFERTLAKVSSVRKMGVDMTLTTTADGFALEMRLTERPEVCVTECMVTEHQTAKTPQRENIVRQLGKLGNTRFDLHAVSVEDGFGWFVPSSLLADLRKRAVAALEDAIGEKSGMRHGGTAMAERKPVPRFYPSRWSYLYNISNKEARDFYQSRGLRDAGAAFELAPMAEAPIMQCRYCLRYAMGYCVKHGGQHPQWHEPVYLRLADGRRFRLEFDCGHCQMNVWTIKGEQ